MNVTNVPIGTLKPFEGNPRSMGKKEFDSLLRSIKEFGFVEPLIVNKDNVVIGGHQRLKAAKILGLKEVPVFYVDFSEDRAKALNIALNKISGIWDEALLFELLKDLKEADLSELTGFEDIEIERLLRKFESSSFPKEDAFKDVPKRTTTGDLWQLGDHRLLCGDSTKAEDMNRLMDGEKAHLIITDPPYGVAYDGCPVAHKEGRRRKWEVIQGDKMKGSELHDFCKLFLERIIENSIPNWSGYIFFSDRNKHHLQKALDELEIFFPTPLIWVKNNFSLNWDRYRPKHETIIYCGNGSKPTGKQSRWFGQKNDTTILKFNLHMEGGVVDYSHPTQKPLDLISYLLRNSSKEGELVLDLFAGSGTTLISAEQYNRKSFNMEIDPRYCDVILQRWEKFTKKEAKKIN